MSGFGEKMARLMAARQTGVRELAKITGYTPSYISQLRDGKKTNPSPDVAHDIDEALGAGGTLAALAGQDQPRPSRIAGLTGTAIELGLWAEKAGVGSGTIELLDDEIERVAMEYASSPPAPLIDRAAAVTARVFSLVRQHQQLRQTRDLYVIGAKSCAFLACALGDLGQQPAAAAHARTALTLAGEAGHPAVAALALSAQSRTAFWDQRRPRAADLARRGYECCPPDSTRVLLACQEADASVIPAAGEAIMRATRAYEEITEDDTLAGIFTCGRARLACYTMTLRLRSGDTAGVLAAAADVEQAQRDGEIPNAGTMAQVRISAALAHLAAGEPEGAASSLAPVLDLPPGMRLATFTAKLALAGRLSSAPPYRGSGPARDLAARVRGYLGEEDEDSMPYPLALASARRP
jgi:transcriptional regulator with XRE-family HTH domain